MTKKAEARDIIAELKAQGHPEFIPDMERYGIRSKGILCISMPTITKMAKRLGKDHELALELWKTDIYDARLLAAFIDDPGKVTEAQMDRWAKDFDSWAVCDGVCTHLFRETGFAFDKAFEWAARDKEFVKRAGFALMASLTVYDKKAPDSVFIKFLPLIEKNADDDRVYVKKAVNWALRQIGKRNLRLNAKAIAVCERLAKRGTRSAKWIASDALRELKSEKVQTRLTARDQKAH